MIKIWDLKVALDEGIWGIGAYRIGKQFVSGWI